ncbi:MAG: hypothetical protein ACOZDY_11535 [Pseudomonadota bacterium]
MVKLSFRIRTRSGTPADSVTIQAQNRETAERRLRQMYLDCEILECRSGPAAAAAASSCDGGEKCDLKARATARR